MNDDCMEPVDEPTTWLDKYREGKDLRVFPETSREPMDMTVSPLTRDVAFNRHSMNDGHHVSPTDNATIQVGTDGIRVALIQGIDEEQLKKTLSAAVRATVGLDMTQTLPGDWERCEAFARWVDKQHDLPFIGDTDEVRDRRIPCDKHGKHEYKHIPNAPVQYLGQKPMEDWEEMLKGGLQTALESQVIVFAVGGASRTATHQLVRSRRAAFHQQSQRAGYMGDCPEVRIPESIWVKPKVRNAYLRSIMESWKAYRIACEEDVAYQDARFILPEGTTNFILLEYSIREFLNVYAYRACSMFQWEIVQIMRQCREVLVEAYPWLDPYVKISCEKTGPAVIATNIKVGPGGVPAEGQAGAPTEIVPHHCTFQGWEDVEGQCSFSWAKHEARTFKPEHHRITREKS